MAAVHGRGHRARMIADHLEPCGFLEWMPAVRRYAGDDYAFIDEHLVSWIDEGG